MSLSTGGYGTGGIAQPPTMPIAGPPEQPPTYAYPLSSPPSPPSPPSPGGEAPRPHQKNRRRAAGAALALALLAGGFGISQAMDDSSTPLSNPAASQLLQPSSSGSGSLAPTGLDIHDLIAKVGPSVVAIEIGQQTSGGVRQLAAGSGVVISADGLVLTNAHVVDLTDQTGRSISNAVIQVKSSDGKTRPATVLGSSPANDIALIRVQDTSGLTPATLGDSDALRVGDDVVAIGNALDLGDTPTVTKGIVSAKNRTLDVDANTQLKGLIQTDAPINHGNSGGALVNAAGEVVGINSAGIPDAQSVGFAIAINTVKPLIEQLKNGTGSSTPSAPTGSTAVLGITMQDSVDGAVITGVATGSGAANAGLKVGDIITKLNGKDVSTSSDVGSIISTLKPDTEVAVVILRGGKTQTVTATLGRR